MRKLQLGTKHNTILYRTNKHCNRENTVSKIVPVNEVIFHGIHSVKVCNSNNKGLSVCMNMSCVYSLYNSNTA